MPDPDKKAPVALTTEASFQATDTCKSLAIRAEIKRLYVQNFLHASRVIVLQAIAVAVFYWFLSQLFEVAR